MKALAAIMIAAISALATTGITSAPLLDVERSDIFSIVGATTTTTPTPVQVIETTTADTTETTTSTETTTVTETTAVTETTTALDALPTGGQDLPVVVQLDTLPGP